MPSKEVKSPESITELIQKWKLDMGLIAKKINMDGSTFRKKISEKGYPNSPVRTLDWKDEHAIMEVFTELMYDIEDLKKHRGL